MLMLLWDPCLLSGQKVQEALALGPKNASSRGFYETFVVDPNADPAAPSSSSSFQYSSIETHFGVVDFASHMSYLWWYQYSSIVLPSFSASASCHAWSASAFFSLSAARYSIQVFPYGGWPWGGF